MSVELDDATKNKINSLYTGVLASTINKTMKYASTGIIIGAVFGIGVASVMGKSRMGWALWCGLGGGGIGYLTSRKK